MKRGRKKAERVGPFQSELSPEREFFRKCVRHILDNTDPSPAFTRELLERYVSVAKPKPLSGPEIAALVDRNAMFFPSVAKAVEHVSTIFVNGGPSAKAIAHHHKRYGMRAAEIKKAREQLELETETIIVTDEVMEQSLRERNEYLRKLEAYNKAKKDLFG